MVLKPFNELPVVVKRSRKHLYEYIRNELNEDTQVATPVRNISVTIKDGSDNAIQGATVTIGNTEKTTGSAGGCSFTDIEDGTHEVSVTKEGYEDASQEITVSSNNVSFEIILDEASS